MPGTQPRQNKETCPNLHLIGEVLYVSTTPNPCPAKTPKRNERDEGKRQLVLGMTKNMKQVLGMKKLVLGMKAVIQC